MLNALRLTSGFDEALYVARTGLPWASVEAMIDRLQERGLLAAEEAAVGRRRISTTTLGMQFLNEVLLEFLPEEGAQSMHSG